MTFAKLMLMMTIKSKQYGLDLTTMENALGLNPTKSSNNCHLTYQSDIEASKRIKAIK
jgi:hypothetical protein